MMEKRSYLTTDDQGEDGDYEPYDSDSDCHPLKRERAGRGRHLKIQGMSVPDEVISDTTVYHAAIHPSCGSTSSDGLIDTSNETVQLDLSNSENFKVVSADVAQSNTADKFIESVFVDYRRRSGMEGRDDRPLPRPPFAGR